MLIIFVIFLYIVCVKLETSPPLTLNPKGVRRARAVLCGSETQDLPDMGRPTCSSASMMYAG